MQGQHVRIEPLQPAHAAELWTAVSDPAYWRLWPRRVASEADLQAMFEDLCRERDRGRAEPFLLRATDGVAAGATSFYDMMAEHRRLAIGYTFLAPDHQRTAMNTETKLLLLREAFDARGMNRVAFHVDARNQRSQRAVERLGAHRDGVLRAHRILHDGHVRDTVVYSIVADEWLGVKARLEALLARPAAAEA